MKRIQVRFSTEEQIIQAIDSAKAKAEAALTHATELEAAIKSKSTELDYCMRIYADATVSREDSEKAISSARRLEMEIKQDRTKIEKLQKTATNLIDKRCKRLGKALSAFRTMPMDVIVGDDQSVVLV